ncbi:MAG: prokaryotic ubiquitin-like protein Pup [Actinomycetota bacterium]|jgi:ubiquitin-like protein Pup|nr:prokaryotic ubiquitin-like protein Pup [Actinomycetota bacterium]
MTPSGEQSRKPKPRQEEEAPQETESTAEATSTEEVDELLDEIDEVLESNAEEFVRSYVQKGGQAFVFFVLAGTFLHRLF